MDLNDYIFATTVVVVVLSVIMLLITKLVDDPKQRLQSLKNCSACSNPVGPNALVCPKCGEPTQKYSNFFSTSFFLKWALAGAFLMVFMYILGYILGEFLF